MSNAVGCGFDHRSIIDRVKPKTMKLVCVPSPLSTYH